MNVLTRITIVAVTAILLFVASLAHAVVGPDDTSSAARDGPQRHVVCLSGNCNENRYKENPNFYVATQNLDCNLAGLGNPTPLIQAANTDGSIESVIPELGDWQSQSTDTVPAHTDPGGPIESVIPELGGWQSPAPNTSALDDQSLLNEFGIDLDPRQYMLFPRLDFGMSDWPGTGSAHANVGAGDGPFKGMLSKTSQEISAGTFGKLSMGDVGAAAASAAERDSVWVSGGFGDITFGEDDVDFFDQPLDILDIKDTFDDLEFETSLLEAPAQFDFTHADYNVGVWDSLSINVESPTADLPESVVPYLNQQFMLDGTTYSSLMFNPSKLGDVHVALEIAVITIYENNGCRRVLVPNDPNYLRTGRHGGNSWGEREDDQWAIKRVGFTDDEYSAWNLLPDSAAPVIVAIIDTGLDWHHLDISADNIWRNEAEYPDNGVDDDNNGYIDDIIGWDFFAKNNKPWDFDGHGTIVAGIIGATKGNGVGIAGINPNVKLMVLKAVNNFGTTRASFIAEAIVYAVDNGAKIINISVGGPHASRMEQAAINFAHQEGVLVVAAAGNDGSEIGDFGPGGNDNVLTVGATHVDNRTAAFSNYGDKVDLVAPGVDVLSLRARFTDANYRPDAAEEDEYTIGDNYVGDDKRYIHVSGTSFSTPIVTGVASLLLSKNPEMSAAEVKTVLIQTATDIELPGKDKYGGHGMVNARAALSIAPDFSITAVINELQAPPTGNVGTVTVKGTLDADDFKRGWIQIGAGENPVTWKYVGQKHKLPVTNGTLAVIPGFEFSGSDVWQVVVNVEHRNGVIKRDSYPVRFGQPR